MRFLPRKPRCDTERVDKLPSKNRLESKIRYNKNRFV